MATQTKAEFAHDTLATIKALAAVTERMKLVRQMIDELEIAYFNSSVRMDMRNFKIELGIRNRELDALKRMFSKLTATTK